MGYTHYWTPKPMNDKDWEDTKVDLVTLLAICAKLGLDLDISWSPDSLTFNGRGDDGHEDFYINKAGGPWSFCKTAAKPYDVAVVACLIYLAAKRGYEVSSDGDAEDWKDGHVLAQSVWGDLPLPVEVMA